MATSGIHAGFLRAVGPEANLYFTDDNGSCSPFNNPSFVKAYQTASHVAFEFFVHSEQEISGALLSCFKRLAIIAKQHLSEKEVREINRKLEETLAQVPKHPLFETVKVATTDDPFELFIKHFGLVLVFAHLPRREKTMDEILLKQAGIDNKNVVSLFSDEEQAKFITQIFENLFNNLVIYVLAKHVYASPEGVIHVQNACLNKGAAWDVGAHKEAQMYKNENKLSRELQIAGQLTPEDQHLMRHILEDECTPAAPHIDQTLPLQERLEQMKHQLTDLQERQRIQTQALKAITSVIDQKNLFQNLMTLRNQTFAHRIADFILRHPKTLFLSRFGEFQETVVSILIERNVRVQGPIRETIKPRGFLWEIKKTDQVVGYFLGSVHLTPRWILERLNFRIIEAFAFCDTLGVEVDITRENVVKTLTSPTYEIPKEKLLSMREVVRIGSKELGVTIEEEDTSAAFGQLIKKLYSQQGIESGIDLEFIQRAKLRKMPIRDLESVESHREFLELLQQKQSKGLTETVDAPEANELWVLLKKRLETIHGLLPEILELGLVSELDRQFEREPSEEQQAMNRRNMMMAMTTDDLIHRGNKPFSIAGCLHFGGDMGMQRLMQKMGYTVTQVICEERLED